jgi:hypothetical protein
MQLPFTPGEFFQVFREYNDTVWPAQLLLVVLALAAVLFALRPLRRSGEMIATVLAILWSWLALAYHLAFFASINPLAYVFSALSLAGAFVFLWEGLYRKKVQFRWTGDLRSIVGIALVGFSLVIYPAWSWSVGHAYPAMPTFGLPCPTTIFTIGMLAFLLPPYPRSLFIVPILWCLIGAQAAFLLGVTEDLSLIVAGVVGLLLLIPAKDLRKEHSAGSGRDAGS